MQFHGVNGNGLQLHCLNYFGFDEGATMFDGLSLGSDYSALSEDYGKVLWRIAVPTSLRA